MFEYGHARPCRAVWLALGLTLARSGSAQSNSWNPTTTPVVMPPEASQPKDQTAKNSADLLFRSGREALQRGDYALACAQLAESDRIEPSPGAKLNRAICEEQRGHMALAWRLLQTCIASLPADDERLLIAQRHADGLRGKLAFVTITLPLGSPKTAQVISDGTELTSADLAVPLAFDIGHHVLELTAPGYAPTVTEFTLAAGANQQLALSLGAPLPGPKADGYAHAPPSRATPWTTVGVGLEGAAAALAVTCVVTGVLAYDAKQDMTQTCDASLACSQDGVRAAARGDSYAAVSTASFIGALVSGGLGAVLLLTSGQHASKSALLTGRNLRWEF